MGLKQPYKDLKEENILIAFPGASSDGRKVVSADGRLISEKAENGSAVIEKRAVPFRDSCYNNE
jgi:hypothetical protein